MFGSRLVRLAALCVLTLSNSWSSAGVIHNGWNYAIDNDHDGSPSSSSTSTYNFKGMAFHQANGLAYFAFSGQFPIGGWALGTALNGRISFGDLFINGTGGILDTAAKFSDPKVIAVHFDGLNDSLGGPGAGMPLGVYTGLTAASYTTLNNGFATYGAYAGSWGLTPNAMGDLATVASVVGYLGSGTQYPNIAAGTHVTGDGYHLITSAATLAALGLDFGHFGASAVGSSVFAIAFKKSLLPAHDFTAHIYQECINDGVALQRGRIPEPSTMAMFAIGVVGLAWARRLKNRGILVHREEVTRAS